MVSYYFFLKKKKKSHAAVRFDVLISNLLDPALNIAPYIGHTDAIWDFKLLSTAIADYVPLVSASADGTVKIWDTGASGNLLKSSWSYNGVINEHQEEQSKLNPVINKRMKFILTNLYRKPSSSNVH